MIREQKLSWVLAYHNQAPIPPKAENAIIAQPQAYEYIMGQIQANAAHLINGKIIDQLFPFRVQEAGLPRLPQELRDTSPEYDPHQGLTPDWSTEKEKPVDCNQDGTRWQWCVGNGPQSTAQLYEFAAQR